MRPKLPIQITLLAFLIAISFAQSTLALPGKVVRPVARIFDAAPGTNTLVAARDSVRVWRLTGHTNQPATILLVRGKY